MAIRLRTIEHQGEPVRVALCAAETDPLPGDVHLDDGEHHALAAKFAADWAGRTVDWTYPAKHAAAATQKRRDAATELNLWLQGTPA